ncbi:MAG: GNAT family N-acetyltransferase [Fimbriimonadaceae bacterium]|nr:GNAT family N-acetyltransferase [Fimbriimonadaceae bacterium]QYK57863.1 MAG: GNAT family N-acetyltransferase [Fimbriimonadaceae bacterium]
MKLLIDTNIFIPLEPTSPEDISEQTQTASRLSQLASKTNTQLWLHPAQRVDIAKDKTAARRSLREQLFSKYPVLIVNLPPVPPRRTNDWVDEQLVLALQRNAVSALITEDRRLTQKAIKQLGTERVLTLADAISLLASLVEAELAPPPAVECVRAYQLDIRDRFWDSFRADYGDDAFDRWLQKCQQEHRLAWVIRAPDSSALVGAAIVNHEKKETRGRKTLKICSFKVDAAHSGRRYGELLLKSVFCHAFENRFDSFYITAFPHHEQLIGLLTDFGFGREIAELPNGEIALSKPLALDLPVQRQEKPLPYFIREGPFSFDPHWTPGYLVPILPKYHAMLFPELQAQQPLVPGREAFGNSLRKAYLSCSGTRTLRPGSILFFYRSEDEQAVRTWGVVEQSLRSDDADRICDFVMPRTVYTRDEIVEMCDRGQVLAIMFRQCLRPIRNPVRLEEMLKERAIAAAPQSLMKLKPPAKQWMTERCLKLP